VALGAERLYAGRRAKSPEVGLDRTRERRRKFQLAARGAPPDDRSTYRDAKSGLSGVLWKCRGSSETRGIEGKKGAALRGPGAKRKKRRPVLRREEQPPQTGKRYWQLKHYRANPGDHDKNPNRKGGRGRMLNVKGPVAAEKMRWPATPASREQIWSEIKEVQGP